MISFTNTITIHKPIEEVFVFVSDFTNIPKWNYFVMQVTPTNGHKPAIGAQYHQVRKEDEQYFEVKAYEALHHFRIQTLPGSRPQFDRTVEFTTDGEFTSIRDTFSLSTAYPAMMEYLFKSKIKNAVYDNLEKLKELLESGSTTLQDGRVMKVH